MPPDTRPIILIGQANVGKSVLFGRLTGDYAWVSNYPGTTVEVARGRLRERLSGTSREVLDTPGVNSLSAESEDERVALRVVADEPDAVLVQVADARNISRALSLTMQLSDLHRPLVLALNFMDEAESAGMKIATEKLEELIGCDVIPMVAVEGRGVGQLRHAVSSARVPKLAFDASAVRTAPGRCGTQANACQAAALCFPLNGRKASVQVPGTNVWRLREQWLSEQLPRVVTGTPQGRPALSEKIDRWLRFFPVALASTLLVAAALYVAVGIGAGAVSDFLTQRLFGQILTPWLAARLTSLGWPALTEFLTGPYGLFSTGLSYGLGLVLPVLAAFFLLFAVLEDSGYLPRLAVLAHRAMERIGLSGKSVVPLILGLGCGTTAVVATRVLPTRRERILAAVLLAVGVPCSAQLGVMLGLVAGLSPWVPLVIAGTVLLQALWVGKLAARLVPGTSPDFILELPPLRLPRPANLLRKTALRVGWYLKEAIPIFLFGSVLLFVLDRVHLIGGLIAVARPVVSGWLGLPAETSVAFVMGFLRRDYGAAGIYALARNGHMTVSQIVVACTTMILFMPCLASFLMMLKEFGSRVAIRVAVAATAVALLAGAALRVALHLLVR